MKDKIFFLKEIEHLDCLILKAQHLQKEFPEDDAIPFMIHQYEFRKKEMLNIITKIEKQTDVDAVNLELLIKENLQKWNEFAAQHKFFEINNEEKIAIVYNPQDIYTLVEIDIQNILLIQELLIAGNNSYAMAA